SGLSVPLRKHVGWLIPGAAQDVTLVRGQLVPTPFLHVAGHVIRAKGADALVGAGGRWTFLVEITGRDDLVRCRMANSARQDPVRNRRQALTGEFRIGGGLVPTDAADRVIVLPARTGPGL